MTVDALLGTLASIVIFGSIGLITWQNNRLAKATVEGELRRYHPTDIKIKWDYLSSNRYTLAYDVEFTDAAGKRHFNSCTVPKGGAEVFWETPMTPPPRTSTKGAALSRQPVACTLTPDQRGCDASDLLPGISARADTRAWTPDGIHFSFAAQPRALEAIAQVIERERKCCAFLTFRLVVPEGGGNFELELSGPPGTRELLEEFGLSATSPHAARVDV